jgi:hypothetical protein
MRSTTTGEKALRIGLDGRGRNFSTATGNFTNGELRPVLSEMAMLRQQSLRV